MLAGAAVGLYAVCFENYYWWEQRGWIWLAVWRRVVVERGDFAGKVCSALRFDIFWGDVGTD